MIQLQVLNKILTTKDSSLITLNNLSDDYFSDYKIQFDFIKDHIMKYGVVPDKETFLATFPSFDIIEVNETDSYLIEELFKDYKSRKLTESFNHVRSLVLDGKTDDAMREYNNTNEQLARVGVALHSTNILTDVSRYDAYEERTKDFSKFYVSTGFKELDSILGGWDREEENAVVIARTNAGKSWLLIKFAEAAVAQGLTVGLYSGEMSERKVGYRFDTLAGHISNGALVHGNASIENDYKNYIDSLTTKYKGKLFVLTPQDIGGPAGVGALRAFIQKENLNILFVDQYSLLEDDKQAKNPVEQMNNIANGIKNLQVMSRVPIICVSQMNRTKNEEEDSIDSTQIAQADRIGQNATIIIGISRDKKDKDLFKLHIVKARDANAGNVITYKVDLNRGIFDYIPSDKDGVQKQDDYSNRYQNDAPKGDVF
jgi:replicative DNA helicase